MKTKFAIVILILCIVFALMFSGCGSRINRIDLCNISKMTDEELSNNYTKAIIKTETCNNVDQANEWFNVASIYQAELNKREIIKAIANSK